MDSSDEELYLFQLLFDEEMKHKRGSKRKRSTWVHDICLKRKIFGEFHTLFKQLLQDEKKIFQYFRMSYDKYSELLEIVRHDVRL
jgi:hypothetical protein